MKIGIIGSGISGLTAAFEFGKSGHQVSLIDQQARIGMAAHGAAIRDLFDVEGVIDVPSRLLNGHHWPSLIQLYREAGVETTTVKPTQTYIDSSRRPYLQIDPRSLFGVDAFRQPWSMLPKLMLELVRLRNQAEIDIRHGIGNNVTFEQYLSELQISELMKFGFLYPLLSSTVCTCSFHSIGRYPASLILEILNDLNQSRKEHMPLLRTRFGTEDVAEKLLCHEPQILTGRKVETISVSDHLVRLACTQSNHSSDVINETFEFDHVVVATQANQAVKMLPQTCSHEISALRQFSYEDVEVVVHADETLLPENRNMWSTFNFAINQNRNNSTGSTCNIWLNQFYGLEGRARRDWFQAINPIQPPKPNCVISRAYLQRPTVTQKNFGAWNQLEALHRQPNRRVWFAGSYASRGVPLLESGVISAKTIVARVESVAKDLIKS